MSIKKDNTENVLKEVDKRISSSLRQSALLVERSAKQFCPVLTGTLKRSIISNWFGAKRARTVEWPASTKKVKGKTVKIKAGKSTIGVMTDKRAIVGTNIEYAANVEMGTSKMAGRSYLRRALETNMSRIKEIFASGGK